MDRRTTEAHVYTWIAEDYAEYWKLIGLSLGGSDLDGMFYTVFQIHFTQFSFSKTEFSFVFFCSS